MREFTQEQQRAMGSMPRFVTDTSEQACPACRKVALRSYLFLFDPPVGSTVIAYTWCAACRRRSGSTGPLEKGLSFTDPLAYMSPAERRMLGDDELFGMLDKLWAQGRLPQKFEYPPKLARYWQRLDARRA